jgi:predicted ArsR family transcriptional regulator
VEPSPWETVTVLVDPVRRALYEYVRRQDHPVTREEAAEAVSISRNLTAFHLDKLVDAGLLSTRYEAPPDRQRGPGRTPKVYEPSGAGVSLTLPPRQYELVGQILADAVVAGPRDAARTAHRVATDAGRQLGAAQIRDARTADGELAAAAALLTSLGFEPRTGEGRILLDNCPFHALAVRQRDLICGLNHAFVAGLLEGLGGAHLRAALQPRPDGCCVQIATADAP